MMQKSSIEIDLELSAPQLDILQAAAARYLLQMGQGGGKTVDIGVISYLFASRIPNVIGFIAANTYGQLSDSTLVEVFNIWKKFGWTEWNRNNPDGYYIIDKKPPPDFKPHGYTFKSNQGKVFLRNGAVIMTASLDNYDAIEGRTFGWALLDETANTKEDAVKKVIISRLRQSGIYAKKNFNLLRDMLPFVAEGHPQAGKQINPLFVFTKPVKEQWLTEFFDLESYREEIMYCVKSETDYFSKHDPENNRVIVIASTFHNQKNLPEDYITQRLKEYTSDVADMLIYASPFGKSGQEYYRAFNRRTHVGAVNYVDRCPLHISFDFNVNPYMTAKIWITHREDGKTYWDCIKEYAMKYPRNSIEATCREIIRDWKDVIRKYGCFIYGDATGKNTMPVESIRSYFKLIQREFRGYVTDTSFRILKQNMRHRSLANGTLGRRDLMNKAFLGGYNFQIRIDPGCENTIKDYEFILEDVNGGKVKPIKEIDGKKCESLGHMSDADDAIFCYLYGNY